MRHKMLALILALTLASWAQTTTPTNPQQSTPSEKAKCSCCDKMAASDAKDAPACCARHSGQSADAKETASCCSGKDEKSCCAGKDAKSCMKSDTAGASCCKESCGKDKMAANCCGEKCGKECGKGSCAKKV